MDSLANHFLIAMPGMGDPNFEETVTFVCEHSDDGALGLVINRPLDMTLAEVFLQLGLESADDSLAAQPVLRGGPVASDRGFVLHPPGGEWDSSVQVSPHVQVTTSQDVLAAMARGDGPRPALIALGYAGWGAGQLEEEIAANSWLSVAADPQIIFSLPFEDRWQRAAGLLGVDLSQLSAYPGHA